MIRSFSYIKLLTIVVILTGFAMASVHKHNVTIYSGDLIVKNGDLDCSVCDGTVKIEIKSISVSSPDLYPISTVSDEMVMSANLPFERIIRDRAPPSRA